MAGPSITAAPLAGLSTAQAQEQFVADGPNELPQPRAVRWPAAVGHQLSDTIVLVLLGAAAMTAAVGDLTDMTIILAVVVLNTVLGAGQEIRSGRALDALAQLTAPQATVVRDGRPVRLAARAVVCGDRLELSAGDIVAADATVVEGHSLLLDESLLTGESVPVDRVAGEAVAAGTVVVRGRGHARVTATGARTGLAGLARSVQRGRAPLTPLQRQLAVLGRRLALATIAAAVVVAALALAGGRGWETSVVLAISLAVAAIPESLPAVVALSLAMAARRMTARGVLVRRLVAVEALGSVTVLAVDKTGTLTTGQLAVERSWSPDAASERRLWPAAVLCNDAGTAGAASDDPLERALLAAAERHQVVVEDVRRAWPRLAEQPFDAAVAAMTTEHRAPDGSRVRVRKGAPERLLTAAVAGGPAALEVAEQWAEEGLRTLAVIEDDGSGWRALGVLGLADPPRPQAAGLVQAFRQAGVRLLMITGDHVATATRIAHQVGIVEPDREAGRLVYARARPDDKTRILREVQAAGEVVAMTGDGVNDAPALRAADIGVAMGRRGTEVAKQAADLILTEDDLSAMVPAIEEGRRAYANLRRFLHYALAGGVAEVLIMLVGPVVGFAIPLQAGQILWTNLLTHGLPGVAMGDEQAEPGVLQQRPRPPGSSLLDGRLAKRVLLLSAVIAAVSLAVAALSEPATRQTSTFLTLTLAQLGVGLALRPSGTGPNRLLFGAILLSLALTAAALLLAPLADLLRTRPLSLTEILLSVAGAAVVSVLARRQRISVG